MRLSATTTTFLFQPHVEMNDVADTLQLARIAAESLFGTERLNLEAPYTVDEVGHSVAIESGTEAGRALTVLFFTYVKREFGCRAVEIGGAA